MRKAQLVSVTPHYGVDGQLNSEGIIAAASGYCTNQLGMATGPGQPTWFLDQNCWAAPLYACGTGEEKYIGELRLTADGQIVEEMVRETLLQRSSVSGRRRADLEQKARQYLIINVGHLTWESELRWFPDCLEWVGPVFSTQQRHYVGEIRFTEDGHMVSVPTLEQVITRLAAG